MNEDFAAAMRRALEHVRAQDVGRATEIIQAALAGQLVPVDRNGKKHADVTPSQRPTVLSPRRIDRHSDSVEAKVDQFDSFRPMGKESTVNIERRAFAARQRRPLGEVVQALQKLRKSRIGGLSLRARRKSPTPDLPEGAQFLIRRFQCTSGSRSYKLYIPATIPERPHGLVVMLHGCTQDADDFAVGTNMNAHAEKHGLLIAYPQQTRKENISCCWNWFLPGHQERDSGEPAIIAGLTQAIAQEFSLDGDQIFIAGLSAGGAMAAVMATTYPELYAAAGIHSGLPHGAADDVMTALEAMRGNRERHNMTSTNHRRSGPRAIIFHGSADQVVHPINADHIFAAVSRGGSEHVYRREQAADDSRHRYVRSIVETAKGDRIAEYWLIDGVGHAWSGGKNPGSFTDPEGPDASAEMIRFFLNRN